MNIFKIFKLVSIGKFGCLVLCKSCAGKHSRCKFMSSEGGISYLSVSSEMFPRPFVAGAFGCVRYSGYRVNV